MTKQKKYWKGLAELANDPAIENLKHNEFVEKIPVDDFLGDGETLSNTSTSRRDFLKFLGFSTAAATLAACETPVIKSIPYVIKPEEITPGVANWYASTFYDGNDFANVLVKTREGRPIFIKPNDLSSAAPNARVISSVLSLYDSNRLKGVMKNGESVSWSDADTDIKDRLSSIDGDVVVLTNTIISPTTKSLLNAFSKKYAAKHVQYDAISHQGMLDANKDSFGQRVLPSYHLDKADVLVSFGADFLGNWLNSSFEKQYIANRNPKSGKMSRHFQIETNMSLSGSNADVRIPVKPSEKLNLIENLYNALKGNAPANDKIKDIVSELSAAKGKSLVICDSNDKAVQIMVNAINDMLGNYGKTIDLTQPSLLRAGDDNAVAQLVQDMNDGKVGALIISGVNPSYTLANAEAFNEGLKKVSLTISTALSMDETSTNVEYVCPDRHYLESWGDAKATLNQVAFTQPTIQPLFDSRQFQESLMTWSGDDSDYYTYLKNYWRSKVSWSSSLHDGLVELSSDSLSVSSFSANVNSISSQANGLELALYQSNSIGDGSQSNNPWLQELPDPITRACWDNYLTISATTARENGLTNWNISDGALNGDMVRLTVGDRVIENVPVLIQPGQAIGTLGLALGYGRTAAGKVGNGVGVNAYSLAIDNNYTLSDVKIEKVEGEHGFASVQLHHTMMGRDLIKETTLAEYIADPKAGNPDLLFDTHKGKLFADEVSLWKEFDHETGHFWNLSIDLTSCIGCNACVVACHSENNVPVVGKEEVRKSRDMHWLRIDRYFSSDMTEEVAEEQGLGAVSKYKAMEVPSENPDVAFQPVMCQHCNHAPCETVCPVAATSHSAEGQNHMAYNRCVGTRYCANNCPYKVRRFNWFDYAENDAFDYNMNDDLGKMVLNPDVTVRVRGVMEKCSMCIQMIQKTKLDAKRDGRKVLDKDAQTACSIACPTNALVFGDVNDESSEVRTLKSDERKYFLLEAINTAPSVFYQTKIRNRKA
ncbi:TAT-variant-translocated molybdopterin oxidoreductase [Flavobacteriales bacterium]|nr:TAT-variant-translocated molybdopterin oxidoreductase [Flavobacteriales bacterium]